MAFPKFSLLFLLLLSSILFLNHPVQCSDGEFSLCSPSNSLFFFFISYFPTALCLLFAYFVYCYIDFISFFIIKIQEILVWMPRLSHSFQYSANMMASNLRLPSFWYLIIYFRSWILTGATTIHLGLLCQRDFFFLLLLVGSQRDLFSFFFYLLGLRSYRCAHLMFLFTRIRVLN